MTQFPLHFRELKRTQRPSRSRSKLPRRVAMLSDAWQIVEQAAASILLLRGLPAKFRTEDHQRYCERFDSARDLRNEFAHVDAKIFNHSKKRSHSSPYFGALKYFKENEEQTGRVGVDGEVMYITAGPIPSGRYNLKVDFLDFVKTPIGGFTFEAFDKTLRLDEVGEALFELLEQLSPVLERESKERTEFAAKDRKDGQELLKPELSDFVVSFAHTVNFLPPEAWSTSGDEAFDQLAVKAPNRAFDAVCTEFLQQLNVIFPGLAASPSAVFFCLLKRHLLTREMSDSFMRLNLVRHSIQNKNLTLTTGAVQALRVIAIELLQRLDVLAKSADLETLLREASIIEAEFRHRKRGAAVSFHWLPKVTRAAHPDTR
jgi:hypothetical protein